MPFVISRRLGICLSLTWSLSISASADTVHLQGGYTIEADRVELRGDVYRITSRSGTHDIEKERVLKIEPGPTQSDEYERELKKHADSAAGHFELACWCDYKGMKSEQLKHLKRVIELDPDHADARKALGYVRQGKDWVKAKSAKTLSDEERENRRKAKEQDAIIRKKLAEWHVKIQAIKSGRLDASRNDASRKQFADGRAQIMGIRDPFAIGPLAEVLSRGDVPTRQLLVEALARFEQDEAVMNLIVLALLDPDAGVRASAGDALAARKDLRIADAVRRAMYSEREGTIRHAAVALGRLKAMEAVPDLVSMLSTERVGVERVSDAIYLDSIIYVFGRPVGYSYGGSYLIYQPNGIGCMGPGALVGAVDHYEVAIKSVYRTEVQEALIAITGQNFGFDRDAWMDWWDKRKK
ncbi:MAG: HEAT repeat domain-containing protein [Planctomycetes bacterium]|nr:HEAT repeat domain-containing protein [Planctomycetota bacterium]